ncbi:YueI family protein [Lactiplantibacillus modestisalitolerans]|uniref:YueI family protein n=1 Tax=Lactiplantibacillus modestisalitolerans TaxID=1457219 RepID=A0ABV5WVL6_9LACO|nr:YueI family protein [Lactiplantibacillus modestisalitolerans]
MADTNQQPVDRIQTAIHGTPKLHPDEQRKYLGTFRERVDVAVTVYQLKRADYVSRLQRAFAAHPDYQLFINGNLDQDLIGPYIQAASHANVQFTIKTDDAYRTADDNYALVLTAAQAIDQNDIDLQNRYQPEAAPATEPESGLLGKIKHLF